MSQIEILKAGIKSRYRRENRFQRYGQVAILFGTLFLLFFYLPPCQTLIPHCSKPTSILRSTSTRKNLEKFLLKIRSLLQTISG